VDSIYKAYSHLEGNFLQIIKIRKLIISYTGTKYYKRSQSKKIILPHLHLIKTDSQLESGQRQNYSHKKNVAHQATYFKKKLS